MMAFTKKYYLSKLMLNNAVKWPQHLMLMLCQHFWSLNNSENLHQRMENITLTEKLIRLTLANNCQKSMMILKIGWVIPHLLWIQPICQPSVKNIDEILTFLWYYLRIYSKLIQADFFLFKIKHKVTFNLKFNEMQFASNQGLLQKKLPTIARYLVYIFKSLDSIA